MSDYQKDIVTAGEPIIINFPYFVNNYPLPIDGYDVLIQLRNGTTEGPLLKEWVGGDAAITRDDAGGIVSLEFTPDFTATLKFKVAYIDCWIKKPSIKDGIRSGILELKLERGVSRQ